MDAKLLLCLSKDLLKFFETSGSFDVSIRVGQESNAKTFNAHSSILIARSPYFATALLSGEKQQENKGGEIVDLTKSEITPQAFEIVLKYLYDGRIALTRHGVSTILEILTAAGELHLDLLIEHIQTYLIEKRAKFLEQSFLSVHQTAFKFESFGKLQEYCTDLAANNPRLVSKSAAFTTFNATGLLSLVQRDELNMDEIDIWESMIKWGIDQTESFPENLSAWSDEDFQNLRLKLQDFIPHIRFYHISSIDFYNRVKPYRRILPEYLYDNLLQHYLIPESHEEDAKSLPRRSGSNISSILSRKQFSEINKLISGNDRETFSGDHDRKYKLLLRGGQDGFTAQKFHQCCDNKGATVTILKVKGSDQIIGGYNPLSWDSSSGRKTDKRGFLFSFEARNRENIVHSKYSRDYSAYNDHSCGPTFGAGYDLYMGTNLQSENSCYSKKGSYECHIIKGSENGKVYFSIDEYEVFRVEND